MIPTTRFLFPPAMLTIVFIIGCNPGPAPNTFSSPAPNVTTGSASWGDLTQREKKTPGLDYACVLHWNWDGTIALAVWIDHNARTRGGVSQVNQNVELHGTLSPQDSTAKPLATIRCNSSDGKTGSLVVCDRTLELADGWLVLVSTSAGDVRVKQLKRPHLKDLKPGANPFLELKNDPEIAAFFAPQRKES